MTEKLYEEIRFGQGDTSVVVIETNQYAGNFERQMAAFVFGAYDADRWHGAEEYSQFEDDARDDPRLTKIEDKVTTVTHEEYDEVSNTIWPTGDAIDYNGVAVFFGEPLTAEEVEIALGRAKKFAAIQQDVSEVMEVLSIKQLTVSVEIKTKTTVTKI